MTHTFTIRVNSSLFNLINPFKIDCEVVASDTAALKEEIVVQSSFRHSFENASHYFDIISMIFNELKPFTSFITI